ncbi:hypothetical protein EFQ99_31535 [Rhizobium vallis]|uniref:Large polyvalent protein associated domain-containing protein n=1 Tax=Rhizobium vallis TaxID=634290 RepID=A0A432PB95_9HYPH|nr:hypothetical protein [Rhizobium vallis]RUM19300.1 hypothetical protein EFQ99_31535 [Rhizobium vallis]
METLPETKIRETGELGADAVAGDVVPRSSDEQPEQPASELPPAAENAETTGDPAPLPEPTIPNTRPLGTTAAAAAVALRSSDGDPDQVASDLRLAEDYARETGSPVPTPELVKQYRDSFRQKTQEAQNATILSESPVLSNWLLMPGNAVLAGDDVVGLAYFERIGRPSTTPVGADNLGRAAPPATLSTPAPAKRTALQVLAQEIAGARDRSNDEIAALEDQIDRQAVPDRDLWKTVLKDVRNGTATREDALSVLTPGVSSFVQEVKEAAKAVPGAAVGSVGKATEGIGQWAQPLAGRPDKSALEALIRDIARAKEIRDNPELIGALRMRIDHQRDILPSSAHGALSDILDGTATPEEVTAILTPSEALNDFIRAVPATLQKAGQEWQDKGANLYRPTPGMEDSIGWKVGTAIGSALPGAVIGAATGGTGAILYGAAEGAGEAASGARKAGLDEAMQTQAALYGAVPGALGAIPPLRLVPGGVARRLPQAGAAKFLTDLAVTGAISGAQSGGKQLAQNSIARSLYAPDRNLFDGVAGNAMADGFANMLLAAGETGIRAALRGRLPSMRMKGATTGEPVSIAEISRQAQASKLRQRDPERFRWYVAQATRNGPAESIYVPADRFVDYFEKKGIDPRTEINRLGWISRSDLDAAIAAGGDLKISTATYAAKIAGSEHDAFFTENAKLRPDDMSAREVAELKRREEQAQKDAEGASIDQQARDAVEGAEKDAETARVNRATRRFVKEAPEDGEAVDTDEQARRAIEGVDKDAEAARVNEQTGRLAGKASGDAKGADLDEQARRAVEGADKDAETARINRKTRRIARTAP